MRVWELVGNEIRKGVDIEAASLLENTQIPAIVLRKGNGSDIVVPVADGRVGERMFYASYDGWKVRFTTRNTQPGRLVIVRHIPNCDLRVCCVNSYPPSEPRLLDDAIFVISGVSLVAGEGRRNISEVAFCFMGKNEKMETNVYTYWSGSHENFWIVYTIGRDEVSVKRGSFLTALYPVFRERVSSVKQESE